MKLRILYILFFFVLTGCAGTKKTVSKAEEMPVKEVIKQHHQSFPDFKTLAARVQLAYQTVDKEQRITVSLRMKKDEVIWAKASILGITLAKIYITPDSVSYYETFGKTYFQGDFSLLSDWLGVDINFGQAQNLLLGESIFALNPGKYTSEIYQNTFKIQPKHQDPNFIHSLFINPQNFRIMSATLSQPAFDRVLNVRYGNYQVVNGKFFPSDVSIINAEEGEQTKIEVGYRKIDLDVEIGFPFEIPFGYKQIQL